jgi:hypothetical protein
MKKMKLILLVGKMKVEKIISLIAMIFYAIATILSSIEVLASIDMGYWEKATFFLILTMVNMLCFVVNLVLYKVGK